MATDTQQFNPRTKFSEIPPTQANIQNKILEIGKLKERENILRDDIPKDIEEHIKNLRNNSSNLKKKLATFRHNFENKYLDFKKAADDMEECKQHSDLAANNWKRLKNSHFTDRTSLSSHYFQSVAEKLKLKMKDIHRKVEEADETISSAHFDTPSPAIPNQLNSLIGTIMKTQQDLFLQTATRVAQVHEECENVKHKFNHEFLGPQKSQPVDFFLLSTNESKTREQRKKKMKSNLYSSFMTQQQSQSQQPAATTGFSFGSTTAQQPATTGFSFGTSATQQPAASTAFNFGTSTAQQPAANTGFSFGTSTAQQPAATGFSFGTNTTQQPAATGFSFGTAQQPQQSQQPAANAGFSFGTSTTQQPAATGSTGFSFGTSQPAATGSTGFTFQ